MTIALSKRGGTVADGFETDEATGINSYTYSARIKERLSSIGASYEDRPKLAEAHRGIYPNLEPGQYFDGHLPTVIRVLSLDQLSALNSLLSNWLRYIRYQTSMVAAERSEAKRQKELYWSFVRKQYKTAEITAGRKVSEQDASDMARLDYRFITSDARYEELNVLYNCLLAFCEVVEADMQVVSREITINQMLLGKQYGIDPNRLMQSWSPTHARTTSFTETAERNNDVDSDRPRPTIPKVSR
jgi:hypothetical protein